MECLIHEGSWDHGVHGDGVFYEILIDERICFICRGWIDKRE